MQAPVLSDDDEDGRGVVVVGGGGAAGDPRPFLLLRAVVGANDGASDGDDGRRPSRLQPSGVSGRRDAVCRPSSRICPRRRRVYRQHRRPTVTRCNGTTWTTVTKTRMTSGSPRWYGRRHRIFPSRRRNRIGSRRRPARRGSR